MNGIKIPLQNIGIHSIGAIPKAIAIYFKLHNSESYFGHSFRRFSATLKQPELTGALMKRMGNAILFICARYNETEKTSLRNHIITECPRLKGIRTVWLRAEKVETSVALS